MAERTRYDCGIVALTAPGIGADGLARMVADEAARRDAGFAFIFHSPSLFTSEAIEASMREHAPGLAHAGCTTAGEITPHGIGDGEALALLLPAAHFTVRSALIENISNSGMDSVAGEVERLIHELDDCGGGPGRGRFAMCLIDGMSFAEEAVTAAIHWALDDIPLVGGSAGDDLRWQNPVLFHNGRVCSDSAVILLVATDLPFSIFKTDNFIPTDAKFVVTASDPDRRIVSELNARPAAIEYAEALGKDTGSLSQMTFASSPVVVRVGGEYFCRAIRDAGGDGSLAFACAIDDGVVLTLAEARGMVESTRSALDELDRRLDGIDMVLGFDCCYRRIDAANRQIMRPMAELYRKYNVVGFGTYGEQYQSMHLNQTLTGIAFGRGQAIRAEAAE
ncbi:MAG: FIST N-terminal domain-containing protein [Rhizobiaceae bacterium]